MSERLRHFNRHNITLVCMFGDVKDEKAEKDEEIKDGRAYLGAI